MINVFTMRSNCGLQISDLEVIKSDFEQKLTIEEAEKVVGGTDYKKKVTSKIVIVRVEALASADAVAYADVLGINTSTVTLNNASAVAGVGYTSSSSSAASAVLIATLPTHPTPPKPC